MARATLEVPGICCEGCEGRVTDVLAPVAGVRSVGVDIARKLVKLEYDEATLSIDQVKNVLRERDYPVESVTVEPVAGAG